MKKRNILLFILLCLVPFYPIYWFCSVQNDRYKKRYSNLPTGIFAFFLIVNTILTLASLSLFFVGVFKIATQGDSPSVEFEAMLASIVKGSAILLLISLVTNIALEIFLLSWSIDVADKIGTGRTKVIAFILQLLLPIFLPLYFQINFNQLSKVHEE